MDYKELNKALEADDYKFLKYMKSTFYLGKTSSLKEKELRSNLKAYSSLGKEKKI